MERNKLGRGNKTTRLLKNQSEGGEREGANPRRFVKGIGAGIRRSVIWGSFSSGSNVISGFDFLVYFVCDIFFVSLAFSRKDFILDQVAKG